VLSYHPSSPSVALVTSPPANSFQDCRLGFPGTDRPSTRLPRRRLPPDIRLGPTYTRSALLKLELVSPPERLRDLVTEVFQLLILNFGTVYHLRSGLRT